MAVGTGQMPVYLHDVKRVLPDMRVLHHHQGTSFIYSNLVAFTTSEKISGIQRVPLQQRSNTIESFPPKNQTSTIFGRRGGVGEEQEARPSRH